MKRLFTILFLGSALMISAVSAQASAWTVDNSHSEVGFDVQHMMISTVHGAFTDYDATINFDPANPASLSIQANIKTTSVDTRNEKRDGHLKNPDFFDVEKFPVITFTSKKSEKTGDNTYKITGDLTIRDVTKEIILTVTGFAPIIKDPYGSMRTAVTATATINREDFGLMWNRALETGGWLVGKDVNIRIVAELVEAK